MRVFYDTEFREDGTTIDLISIGLVTEDGREYYAVNSDADWEAIKSHPWLSENVVPYLPLEQKNRPLRNYNRRIYHFDIDRASILVKPKWVIANEVRAFLQPIPDLELWGYYPAYDHVALAQLWGRMIDLPEGVPMQTNCIKQEAVRLGNPELPKQESDEHHALADARWNRQAYEFLKEYAESGRIPVAD